ncbi:MAG: nuclear transport factor 2 family protein [Proteobacteria bacterium]|nr:nuclear transport factor 2 family protein [Pseudomonadota bacterium]
MTADDYIAIQNLVYRYGEGLDRGDFAAVARLFEHAALYVPVSEDPLRGAAAIEALFRRYTRLYPDSGTPHTRHLISNVIIEPQGEAAARARSSVLVFQATAALPLQPVIGGWYFDRFECVDGLWRFSERRMQMDLFGDLSAHLLQPVPSGSQSA